MKFLLSLLLCCSSVAFSNEHSCYKLKRKVFFSYAESSYFKNQEPLARLIQDHNICTIVEVGCWFGQSTIFMAEQLPRDGIVYAIDSWIGYPREIYHTTRHVYERFLSNVVHTGMTERIIPIRKTSLSASQTFSDYEESVDMIYIDADHSYEAVYADLVAWSKYVKKGGVFCGNLYSKIESEEGEIRRAVLDYCKAYGKTAQFHDFLWVIE